MEETKRKHTDVLFVEVKVEAFYELDRRGLFADTLREIAQRIEDGDGECEMDAASWIEKADVDEEDRLLRGEYRNNDIIASFEIKQLPKK